MGRKSVDPHIDTCYCYNPGVGQHCTTLWIKGELIFGTTNFGGSLMGPWGWDMDPQRWSGLIGRPLRVCGGGCPARQTFWGATAQHPQTSVHRPLNVWGDRCLSKLLCFWEKSTNFSQTFPLSFYFLIHFTSHKYHKLDYDLDLDHLEDYIDECYNRLCIMGRS